MLDKMNGFHPPFYVSWMHEASPKNGRPLYASMHDVSQPTLSIAATPTNLCTTEEWDAFENVGLFQ
jgi:hypothetical protein